MDDTRIKELVLKANEEAHDSCAANHTRSVPYQSRKNTRRYIWNLIKSILRKHNIDAKDKRVLEVACGTGTFVKLFDRLNVKSYDGIDISNEMLKIAKAHNSSHNVNFYKMSLEEYSKENTKKYDIIVSSSFLHHLVDLEDGLIQIKQMLKPGGVFIALHEVVNKRNLTKLEVFDNELSYLFGYQGHVRFPLKQRLKRFLSFIFNKSSSCKNKISQENCSNTRNIDFVDYQLNFDFNLSDNKIAKKYGDVMPYCYYNFAEFRFIQRTMNHNLFVMKN